MPLISYAGLPMIKVIIVSSSAMNVNKSSNDTRVKPLPLRSRIKQRIKNSFVYRYFLVKPLAFCRTYLVDKLFSKLSAGEGESSRTSLSHFDLKPLASRSTRVTDAGDTVPEQATTQAGERAKDSQLNQTPPPRLIAVRQQLGKGNSGVVNEIDSPEGVKARKTLKKDKDSKELETEYQLLRRLNHPNILKVDEVDPTTPAIAISSDEDTEPGFVLINGVDEHAVSGLQMEKADYTLKDVTGAFDRTESMKFIGQLSDALNYLLSQGVAWLDIKPDNLLVKNRNLLLADFGGAVQFNAGERVDLRKPGTSFTITPIYCAPELWKAFREKTDADLDASKCMSWSIGLTLAELMTGEKVMRRQHLLKDAASGVDQAASRKGHHSMNFKAVDDIPYQQVIADYLSKHRATLGEPALTLLQSLLAKDPAERLSLADAMAAIKRLQESSEL